MEEKTGQGATLVESWVSFRVVRVMFVYQSHPLYGQLMVVFMAADSTSACILHEPVIVHTCIAILTR